MPRFHLVESCARRRDKDLMATYAAITGEASTPVTELPKVNATLNSWKEIAVFLGRGVRTVQRWESELGLPVHRIRQTDHSPVFAFESELRMWLEHRRKAGVRKMPSPNADAPPSPRTEPADVLHRSHHLTERMRELLEEQSKATKQLMQNLETTVAMLNRRAKIRRLERPATEGGTSFSD